jgi:NitT/TauT family transport system permease protein
MGVLLAWYVISLLYPAVILPSPYETLIALVRLFLMGAIWEPLGTSMLRLIGGFSLAFVLGSALGLWLGRYEHLYALIRPMVAMLQSVPPISLILLAILWFGIQGGAQIFVITLALFPVFFYSSVQGVQQLPKDLLEMAEVFKVGLWLRIKDIYIPALWPFLSAAVSICIGNGWKTIVMSELISGHTGIGSVMNTARLYLKTDEVIAWTLLVAVLGMSMERLFLRFGFGYGHGQEKEEGG